MNACLYLSMEAAGYVGVILLLAFCFEKKEKDKIKALENTNARH